MRLVTYIDPIRGGRVATLLGAAPDENVVDLADASAGLLPSDALALLALGPDAITQADDVARDAGRGIPLGDVELDAPIPRPPKILAAAANYQGHIIEGGLPPVDRARIVPKLFMKPSTTILAPDRPILLPGISQEVDWELELGVVIGRRMRDVPAERALESVAGYCIVNDVSARTLDWGLPDRQPTNWDSFFDWLNGKWPDGFCPCGPWILTADEVPDPQALTIELRVNGEVRQHGSTAEMLFSVADLVAFASRFMTLEPGDLLATGTPAGVGDTTRTYLRAGDVMEGTITGLGVLRTPVDVAPVDRTPAAGPSDADPSA
jgi:2-keto-4-pentenoate hydratase/2-oxohepta-3-ene-1,7-dioic acid hydratase in catechol pathway